MSSTWWVWQDLIGWFTMQNQNVTAVVWASYALGLTFRGHKTRCALLDKTFSVTVQLLSSFVSSALNTDNLKGYDTGFSMNMCLPILLLLVSS